MKTFVRLLVAVVLTVLIVFGLLQTRPAREALAAWLGWRWSGEGRRVRITGLRGWMPFHVNVEEIRLSDQAGEWLEIGDAYFRLAVAELFHGRIVVREAGAAVVRLRRRPAGPAAKRRAAPLLGYRGPMVDVTRLDIAECAIGEVEAGKGLVLALQGRARAGRGAGRLQLQALSADRPGGPARLEAEWTIQRSEVRLDFEVWDEPDGPLVGRLLCPVDGSLHARLSGQGPPEAVHGQFRIEIGDRCRCEGIFTFDVRPPLALEIQGNVLDVRWPILGQLDRVGIRAQAAGLQTIPEGAVQVEVPKGEDTWKAAADFRVEAGRVCLSKLDAHGAGMSLRGRLAVEPASGLAEGELIADVPELRALAAPWGWTAGGRATVTAVFAQADGEQQILVEAQVERPATPFGEAADLRGRAELQDVWVWPNGRLHLEACGVRAGPVILSNVVASAEGDLDEFQWRVRASGAMGDTLESEAGGSWFRLGAGGNLRLELLQGQLGALPFRLDQPVRLALRPDGAETGPWKISVGAGRLDGSATISKGQIELGLSVTNVPLPVLVRFGLPELEGQAAGRLTVTGPLDRPAAELALRLTGLAPGQEAIRPPSPAELDAHLQAREGHLGVELWLSGWSETPAFGRFKMPLDWSLWPPRWESPGDGALSGQIRADVDLAFLLPSDLLENQIVRGRVAADLQITGTRHRPAFRGKLVLRDGYYEHLDRGTVLKEVTLLGEAENGWLVLREGRAEDGGRGRYEMEGQVQLSPGNHFPFSLRLRFREAALLRQSRFSLDADGDVALDGSLADARLTGRVTLREADYRLGVRMPPELVQLDVIEINRPGGPALAPAPRGAGRSPLRLDLDVQAPDRLFIRGLGLDSEWSASLRLTGDAEDPVYAGSLNLVRGRFLFLGRRFTLERGVITWHGESPPTPQLDLLARARAAEADARLALTGPLEAPAFELASDPPLPPDEIMARLLFGRSADRISPMQALQLAHGLNVLRGGGSAFDVLGRGQSLLRLDQLEIRPDPEQPGHSAIAIGKYLGSRVFLQGEKSVAGPGDLLLMEVELSPSLRLQTETAPRLREGIRLNWSRDY